MKRKFTAIILMVALVLALALPMAPVGAADGYLAGNDAISRANTDSRTNFYLVDQNNPFDFDSMVTEWNIYASRSRTVGFMIYRYASSTWSVVYNGTSDLKTPTVGEINTYTLTTPVAVQAGDFVGLYFGAQAGAVPYEVVGAYLLPDMSGTVLFTDSGGGPTAFTGSSNRTYSVNAEGVIIVSSIIATPTDGVNPVATPAITHTITATITPPGPGRNSTP